jgi:phosphohistidine swiveling domain-containing protein
LRSYGTGKYLKELTPNVKGDYRVVGNEYFIDADDQAEMARYIEHPGFFEKYVDVHRRAFTDLETKIRATENLSVQDDEQAKKEFAQYVDTSRDYVYLFEIGLALDEPIMNKVLEKIPFDEAISYVQPEEKSDINKEAEGLRALRARFAEVLGEKWETMDAKEALTQISKDKDLYVALEKHAREYSYLPTQIFKGTPWTLEDYIERAKTIGEAAHMPHHSTLPQDKELRLWITRARIFNEIRMRRIELINKWIWKLRPLWEYCMRRFDLTWDQLISLGYDELQRAFETGEITTPKSELDRRRKAYNASFEHGTLSYESTTIEEKKVDHNITELKGFVASKGKVSGKVVIVRGADDFHKIKGGEILVAVLTTPNYVGAMAKSAAIVTDVGGITSHAAVVSRELGKPCIIGTKIATQVLKDGDMVAVDAEQGIVTILQNG